MKEIKKVIIASVLCTLLTAGAATTNAGIIVNLTRQTTTETQCVDQKSIGGVKVDSGIIVNLTGIIVNFTGVIVNFTGVIVNYTAPAPSDCGYIPTSD
jgi:hypothetical protein